MHLMLVVSAQSQTKEGYQMPDPVIAGLIDAPPTPGVSISPNREYMLLLKRPNLPSIEEVAQEELRLAGIRINPKTNGSSRSYYYNGLTIQSIKDNKQRPIQGLPADAKIENVSWSPDGSQIGFTITKENGLELWIADFKTAEARALTGAVINDAMSGLPYRWLSDGQNIIYKQIIADRGDAPKESTRPSGPTIQENKGKAAPVRTYQDLIKNAHDEALFEYYTATQLMWLETRTGKTRPFAEAGIIKGVSPSPDGQYVMVMTIEKPFSYIVPSSRFPFKIEIYDRSGQMVQTVAQIPLAENIPKGFGAVRTGPRNFSWRSDQPASLYWVEAQDGGDPKKEAAVRDRLFRLDAPFKAEAAPQLDFELRYGGTEWGNGDLAIAYEWWWTDRRLITSQWQPEAAKKEKQVIFDRSWEDSYNDPGDFASKRNQYGRSVLRVSEDGKSLFLMGEGASPEGNRPFIDKYAMSTGETTRLWRSEAPYYESIVAMLDDNAQQVLTRRESREEPPNYFQRDMTSGKIRQLTTFEHPYLALKEVKKELIRYQRADGVELTGTLYLPANYDPKKDGKLPVFMWAYPREFKSANAAGQVKDSPYEFIRIGWWSPIFWVTQGYAVLDDFGMPIIGEGEEEPNETFVEQLRSGAEAAVNKLEEMGVADRERLAVGGHSYGAFMTANLMAHTDLFAAGIARSGAYNRTLTPFGFQSEERTFWEAPETYFKMSPFMHADKIKEPLLLIHGEADNNSGTYPMQSERFFTALKGHGASVRLVMLPHESHGYRARESVMHMLWEMSEWLDEHVKGKERP